MKKRPIAITGLLGLIASLSSCIDTNTVVSDNVWAFDTLCLVRLYNSSEKTIGRISYQLDYFSRIFDSDVDYSSPTLNTVYTLNMTNDPIVVPYELGDCINKAIELGEETNGYFNLLSRDLNQLWKTRIFDATPSVPSENEITREMEKMSSSSISLSLNQDNSWTVTRNGDARIDLGGIAKGYALKWVESYLEEKHIDKYMVNLGHSSVALGKTPNGEKWTLNISDGNEGRVISIKTKGPLSISTSGSTTQKAKIGDKTYTHIVNPKTGSAEATLSLVSLSLGDPLKEDVYSTAAYTMGKEEGLAFLSSKGAKYVVADGKSPAVSEGF